MLHTAVKSRRQAFNPGLGDLQGVSMGYQQNPSVPVLLFHLPDQKPDPFLNFFGTLYAVFPVPVIFLIQLPHHLIVEVFPLLITAEVAFPQERGGPGRSASQFTGSQFGRLPGPEKIGGDDNSGTVQKGLIFQGEADLIRPLACQSVVVQTVSVMTDDDSLPVGFAPPWRMIK